MRPMGDTKHMHRLAMTYIDGRRARAEIVVNTYKRVRATLEIFADSYGAREVKNLSRSDIERFLATRGHCAVGTRRNEIAAIRAFCTWLQRQGHIRRDPMIDIANPRLPRRVSRAMNDDAADKLWAALPDKRARAIVALMLEVGLRRVEVSRAQVGDWDRLGRTILVTGKGGHQRLLPIGDHVARVLAEYLVDRGSSNAGALIQQDAAYGNGPLSPPRIGALMRRWMRVAGVKEAAWDGRGCHSLRHTCASRVADVEPDLRVVQYLLGHANLQSTQIYLRAASIAKLREAMERAA